MRTWCGGNGRQRGPGRGPHPFEHRSLTPISPFGVSYFPKTPLIASIKRHVCEWDLLDLIQRRPLARSDLKTRSTTLARPVFHQLERLAKRLFCAAGTAVLLSVTQAFAIVMDPATPDSAYRKRGTDALSFPGRPVYIKRYNPSERLGSLGACSGVLLNRYWVMTAAHCIQPHQDKGIFLVGTAENGEHDSGKLFRARKVVIHPKYNGSVFGKTIDLALLQLESPIEGFPDAILGTSTPQDSTTIVTAGYGMAGIVNSTLPSGLSGWLRGWHAPKKTARSSWDPTTSFQTDFRSGNYLHANGCPGDSGSPAYQRNTRSNVFMLVGIVSAGSPLDCRTELGTTAFTDTTKPDARNWIAATIASNPPPTIPQPDLAIFGSEVLIRLPNPKPPTASRRWLVSESADLRTWGLGFPFLNGVCARPLSDHFFYRLIEDVPWVTAIYDNRGELGATTPMTAYDIVPSVNGAIRGDRENKGVRTVIERVGGTLEAPFHPDLNPSGPFSFEIWVRPLQTNQVGVLGLSRTPHPTSGDLGGWLLLQGIESPATGNGFQFGIHTTQTNSTTTRATYSMTLKTNTWYHAVGVYDGTSAILYVNGLRRATVGLPNKTTFRPNSWGPLLTCGRRASWFLGDLDEPAFYGRALTDAEVQSHYQAGVSDSSTYQSVILGDKPKGYWPLTSPTLR